MSEKETRTGLPGGIRRHVDQRDRSGLPHHPVGAERLVGLFAGGGEILR